nr:ATP-binding protein [Cytobacillus sp. NCCP-133]
MDGDQGISTAILDRLFHRKEVIRLNQERYRIKHRSTIFGGHSRFTILLSKKKRAEKA